MALFVFLWVNGILNAHSWVTQENKAMQVSSESLTLIEKDWDLKKPQILLEGEIVKPGLYRFQKGTTLSKILIQAGGFTPIAYPIGAILMRDFKHAPKVRDRMIIEADYVLLQIKPELDILIEPGDHLIIPKRPNHVSVRGEVVQPQKIQFDSGCNAFDYIQKCGGLKKNARGSSSYVLLPNGEMQQLLNESWRYKKLMIPPGAEIIVQ